MTMHPTSGLIQPENAQFFVKGTDEHMRGFDQFQFELNKTYHHDSDVVVCCTAGFHCCDQLKHISATSPHAQDGHSRYFIVKAWGHYQVKMTPRKYAFQHMEFVTELKYKTLHDVTQALADIRALFWYNTRKRQANLKQFLELQAQFPKQAAHPSVLLKRRSTSETRVTLVCMPNYTGSLWKPCSLDDFPSGTMFDIYCSRHKPTLCTHLEDARAAIARMNKS